MARINISTMSENIKDGTPVSEAIKYILKSSASSAIPKGVYIWRALVAGALLFNSNHHFATRNDSAELAKLKSIILSPPTNPVLYPGQLITLRTNK